MSGYSIKEFRKDGCFWRIDWLGQVHPNPDIESEPKIDVLLTKLKDGYTDTLSNRDLTEEQEVASIGIGQLPLLRVGSIWKDQQLHAYLNPTRKRLLEFEIDTTLGEDFSFKDRVILKGESVPLIPSQFYRVGKHYPRIADAPLVVFTGPSSGPNYLIIPRFELLRFYYAASSKLAFFIWEDAIDRAINQSKSALLADNDVRIHLRREMKDREAYLLGRWFLSDQMRKEITSFRNKRNMAAANHTGRTPFAFHPDIGFPFCGKTKLRALGKWMKLHEDQGKDGEPKQQTWAFLALHLLHCTHPMPYRNIVVDRDNRNLKGQNDDDENLLPAWAEDKQHIPLQDTDNESLTTLVSDEEPQIGIRNRVLDMYEQQFDLTGHRLVKEAVEVQKYKTATVVRGGDSFVEQYGTGEGTYGESHTAPAEVVTNPPTKPERYLVTMMPFIGALRWLREQPNVVVETLPLGSESMLVAGESLYLLPPKIRKMRSWHRIDADPPRSRGIMVAKVTHDDGTFYLLEIERKGKNESFSTLVLGSRYGHLSDTVIKGFLMTVARSNGWPQPNQEGFHHLLFGGVDHYKDDAAGDFAQRLLATATSLELI